MSETNIPFNSLLVDLLLPPASLAWLALLALLLPRRMRPRRLAAVFLVPLVLLSMPMVAQALLASLDPGPADSGPMPGAIVILSAEAVRARGGELEVGPLTLERERAGAALARATRLPVLVTGGLVNGPPPVGVLMEQSLRDDFGVKVRWTESRSGTTWENAQFSVPMLKADGVRRVYLVTHAWHMRRSLLAFQRAGMDVVPAPVRPDAWPRGEWGELIPRESAWTRSFYAIHEYIGLLYYGWRR